MDEHKHENKENLSINSFSLFICKPVIWKNCTVLYILTEPSSTSLNVKLKCKILDSSRARSKVNPSNLEKFKIHVYWSRVKLVELYLIKRLKEKRKKQSHLALVSPWWYPIRKPRPGYSRVISDMWTLPWLVQGDIRYVNLALVSPGWYPIRKPRPGKYTGWYPIRKPRPC